MTTDMLQGLMEEVQVAPEAVVSRNRYGYEVDGQRLRRVTTLLRGIPKDWLGNWAAKVVAEFAVDHRDSWSELSRTDAVKLLKGSPWSKRDDAADRGSAVHAALEAYARGEALPDDLTDEEAAYAQAGKNFMDTRGGRPLAVELTVFNLTLNYAGTLDLWEIVDGESWLLDYKTGSGVYAEHAVQLAAYRHAEYAVVNKSLTGDERWVGKMVPWGPQMADRLGVVHVQADGATLHPVRYTERLWDVFRAAAFTKVWQLDTDSFAGRKPREEVFEEPITVEAA